jgi:Organic solute transporter Ostalpha
MVEYRVGLIIADQYCKSCISVPCIVTSYAYLCKLVRTCMICIQAGYTAIAIVACFSQMWALYVLLLFFSATHKDMAHVHVINKFLAIKGVVFFSWWQGQFFKLQQFIT